MLRLCFFWRSHTYQLCDFLLGLLQLVYLQCSIWPPLLMQHRPTLAFKSLILFLPTLYLLLLHPHHSPMLLAVSLYLLLPLLIPDSLRVLQWNAGDLRTSSTKLLHFISSHHASFVCIQEYNLNLSSSFRIPGFSALKSDHTHTRFGIFSIDATHTSGGVIILIRQGLSFSELLLPLFLRLTPTLIM